MQGSYNNYECGLAISDAEAADDGDWSCEFESYVRNGKRGDGTLASVSGGLALELETNLCEVSQSRRRPLLRQIPKLTGNHISAFSALNDPNPGDHDDWNTIQ